MARVRIFDLTGAEICEFVAPAPRRWVLNGVGRCTISLSVLHPAARRDITQFGHGILVSGNPYLPLWGGVIDPELGWQPYTMVLTAYSGEYLLDMRAEAGTAGARSTPGNHFRRIIRQANRWEDLGIMEGNIWEGGRRRTEILGPGSLLEDAQRIAKRVKNDFVIEPFFDEGTKRLRFLGHWLEQAGQNTDLVLEEGVNLELSQDMLKQIGPIVNRVRAFGDASTEDTRPSTTMTDEESQRAYRLRGRTVTFNGAKEQERVEQLAEEYLAMYAQPWYQVQPVAVEDGSGSTFLNMRCGNTVQVKFYTAGFHPSPEGGWALGITLATRLVELEYDDVSRVSIKGEAHGDQ